VSGRQAGRRGLTAALIALGAIAALCANVAQAALLDFSPAERQRILQHGPWPPPPARDPGNPVAGQPAAIELGRRLFFDARLSPDGALACAGCHVPSLAFADGRPRSTGREVLARNAPSLWNAVHQRWYGWDGATDSLWSQAIGPLTHPQEMAGGGAHLRRLAQGDPALACRYRSVFGNEALRDDERALVQTAQALGAWVGTLVSGRSAFDSFREALARGDGRAAAAYPLEAQRGLRLFVGRARCATCHTGPMFSNGEFADIGVPFFVRPGVVDPGRHGGITALQASRFNLLGPYSSARADAATKTRHVELQHRNFGEFKVPSLRNVGLTAPYMHDGQLATLADVVRHYDQINLDRLHADGERILEPLGLSEGERSDLGAFLQSLTAPDAAAGLGPSASAPPATRPARGSRRCPA